MNHARGLKSALFFGAIGFITPSALAVSLIVARSINRQEFDWLRRLDFQPMIDPMIAPTLGLGFVFLATGWATHAPRDVYRFTGTLVRVVLFTVPGWWFGMSLLPRGLKGDRPGTVLASILALASPPILTGLILAASRSRVESSAAPGPPRRGTDPGSTGDSMYDRDFDGTPWAGGIPHPNPFPEGDGARRSDVERV